MRYLLQLVMITGATTACSSETKSQEIKPKQRIQVIMDNQSQFEVEKIFIHGIADQYAETENLLPTPLAIGQQWQTEVEQQEWYVTVMRKANIGATLLAYTTAWPWDPRRYPRLIYFDEQFRAAGVDVSNNDERENEVE